MKAEALTRNNMEENASHWPTAFFASCLAVFNWAMGFFTLDIVNMGELTGKLITAVVVGFGGGAAGVLGKRFLSWYNKTKPINRLWVRISAKFRKQK